ncbi:MAG: methyltransferase domain-containing protein [Actinomycetota bacterium]
MPDPQFAEARLARIYDAFEGARDDLDHYEALIAELGGASVLDVGCGTGSLAVRLAARGYQVVGVDPAAASLAVAEAKPGAEQVRWIEGTAAMLPAGLSADISIMTGNVAMVFADEADWAATLEGLHRSMRPGGRFVFETRDPAQQQWLRWNRHETQQTLDIEGEGVVDQWIDVEVVDLDYVEFVGEYRFADGTEYRSRSRLWFREQPTLNDSLLRAGFRVDEIRDAPDRPGLEWVYVTTRL